MQINAVSLQEADNALNLVLASPSAAVDIKITMQINAVSLQEADNALNLVLASPSAAV
eukprot:CAMPEP_0113727012 /NCGR_PEP_ID=MMETSP0038_2-20120614/40805_1 /TAXON_ID=2898 /ORGANISM="Cryptomonas paramecium" /LENGTH=57 /DNA_ID=CAMNT_0000657791 /DNA_START=9 /DNA_END=179 /DNA_ORIENTATION=+ /assembly_acc=CAM_ASM_000170